MHAPLFIDVAGLRLTDADRARLAHPLVGGLILFGRNWKDRKQLTALCKQIKAVRKDLIIAVDHEGGRVQRFRTDGFTHLPPMAQLGELWMQAPRSGEHVGAPALRAMNTATAAGYVLGAELRACGVDMTFAPVLDLHHGSSSVIGDRAFARDPQVVTVLAQALVQGLTAADAAHCGKHFPGHGFAAADTHHQTAVDKRRLNAIVRDDALPYAWMSATLKAVMPAHVIYPQVDALPAGYSARWLQDILRNQMGFTGAVFTDDLSMAAARRIQGVELSFTDASLLALEAGCDQLLLCNQSLVDDGQPIDDAIDRLSQAVLEERWMPSEASEQRRRALLPRGPALAWEDLVLSERYQHALTLLP
jgi:beta-N-acetylhexosaminidase